MITQTIRNNYDNIMVQDDVDLLQFLQNPYKGKKDDVPLWLFVRTNDRIRKQSNYSTIHAMIIEFDGGVDIPTFELQYANLRWCLHTTSSHTMDKHKFRVIIPFDHAYTYEFYHSSYMKKLLIEYFPGVDQSCFSNFQKIPAMCAHPAEYYYRVNKGTEVFSLAKFADRIWEMEMDDKLERMWREADNLLKPPSTNGFEAYKKIAFDDITARLDAIPRAETGNRYTSLTMIAGSLISTKCNGQWVFDDYEVQEIIESHTKDPAVQKMVRDFCNNRNRR